MKPFTNLQSLWAYCLYCPICKNINRNIEIEIGPDDMYTSCSFIKRNNILTINFTIRQSYYKHYYTIHINVVDNTFYIIKQHKSSPDIKELFFYLYSSCVNCDSYTNSADLRIDSTNNKLLNSSLEQEAFSLSKCKDKYHISINYNINEMLVYRLLKNKQGLFVTEDKEFKLPILKLDFSNQKKVVEKIKTLLIFS